MKSFLHWISGFSTGCMIVFIIMSYPDMAMVMATHYAQQSDHIKVAAIFDQVKNTPPNFVRER